LLISYRIALAFAGNANINYSKSTENAKLERI
jgi:hypothetical protein